MLQNLLKNRFNKLKEEQNLKKLNIIDRMISEGTPVTEKSRSQYRQMLDRVLGGRVKDPHIKVLNRIVRAMGGEIVIRFDEDEYKVGEGES